MTRPIYLTFGIISLALGVIGIPLPLLPTTPFVLLAAFCFSRSHKPFHDWLLRNRVFGPMIRDWEAHGVIPLKVKCLSSTMMLLMVSYPLIFRDLAWWLVLTICITALIGLAYVWSRPSEPRVATQRISGDPS